MPLLVLFDAGKASQLERGIPLSYPLRLRVVASAWSTCDENKQCQAGWLRFTCDVCCGLSALAAASVGVPSCFFSETSCVCKRWWRYSPRLHQAESAGLSYKLVLCMAATGFRVGYSITPYQGVFCHIMCLRAAVLVWQVPCTHGDRLGLSKSRAHAGFCCQPVSAAVGSLTAGTH